MKNKIDLKLLINEENSRLVFLECGRDFVDVLLSFLVMPVGAVVRLTEKGSGLSGMDALYESVENLDANLFQTQACKDMLLHPNYAHNSNCDELVIKIDPEPQHHYYYCPCHEDKSFCSVNYYSTVKNSRCLCGGIMDKSERPFHSDSLVSIVEKYGVFIKFVKVVKFIITNDLHISASSTEKALFYLKQFGISQSEKVREKVVQAGREEVLQLLKRSLVSKTPLSDVFLAGQLRSNSKPRSRSIKSKIRIPSDESKLAVVGKKLPMKLFLSKSTKRVLSAEASGDVIDFLFSFLTYPLGLLPNFQRDILTLGCISNLHSSVSDLNTQDQLRTYEHFSMLFQPKLVPHHDCESQILKIEKAQPAPISVCSLKTFGKIFQYTPMNPKIGRVSHEGGGFVKRSTTFMVTNDLRVQLSSAFASISIFSDLKVPIDDVEQKIVNIGEEEALLLLKAFLIPKPSLSQIF